MRTPHYPSLYQINTRVWINELARRFGKPMTLDDIPDSELDRITEMGFDWVWLLSVWQTGPDAQRVSRSNPEWRREFHETLPDLTDEDIPGSGFAITGYTVHDKLGGDAAMARLRERPVGGTGFRTNQLAQRIATEPPDPQKFPAQPNVVDPREIMVELDRTIPKDWEVVCGSAHFTGFAMSQLRGRPPERYHIASDFGAIGQALANAAPAGVVV